MRNTYIAPNAARLALHNSKQEWTSHSKDETSIHQTIQRQQQTQANKQLAVMDHLQRECILRFWCIVCVPLAASPGTSGLTSGKLFLGARGSGTSSISQRLGSGLRISARCFWTSYTALMLEALAFQTVLLQVVPCRMSCRRVFWSG